MGSRLKTTAKRSTATGRAQVLIGTMSGMERDKCDLQLQGKVAKGQQVTGSAQCTDDNAGMKVVPRDRVISGASPGLSPCASSANGRARPVCVHMWTRARFCAGATADLRERFEPDPSSLWPRRLQA